MKITATATLNNGGKVELRKYNDAYKLTGRMPHKKTQAIVFSKEAMAFFFSAYCELENIGGKK